MGSATGPAKVLITRAPVLPHVYVAEETVCHESPLFFVIEGGRSGLTGNPFLVKSKFRQDHPIPCTYSIEKGDFEVPSKGAEYFFALENEFLYLDKGTGPYRRLIVWNLNDRKEVFSSGFTSITKMDSTHIWYWNYTGDANESNCPEKKEWEKSGLGAAIETHIRLSKSDFSVFHTSETRCTHVQ